MNAVGSWINRHLVRWGLWLARQGGIDYEVRCGLAEREIARLRAQLVLVLPLPESFSELLPVAREIAQKTETIPTSGEYKHATAYGVMLKRFPHTPRADCALAVEVAFRQWRAERRAG